LCRAFQTADHLVDDEQHVVFFEDRLDFVEVSLRWHKDTARSHYRLGDEGGNRIRSFLLD